MQRILLLILLLPCYCFAQHRVSGQVVDITNNAPIKAATVLLSNTTYGTASADSGMFVLTGVRSGQYDLVISAMGYETYMVHIAVNAANVNVADLKLVPKSVLLDVVTIKPDGDRKNKLRRFLKEFLGTGKPAKQCKILNPDLVNLSYKEGYFPVNNILEASSDDFLEIVNNYLGYKIKYLLKRFEHDNTNGGMLYVGSTLFEEMKGTTKQVAEWKKNRLLAYKGSSMNFLRAILAGNMPEQHFIVKKLKNNMLQPTELVANNFVVMTDEEGVYAIKFTDQLYITYTGNNPPDATKVKLGRGKWTTVNLAAPYALFDTNGIILDPTNIAFDGEWGDRRMAETLPFDYQPGD